MRSRRAPTAIDLFCGAGGLSLGLTNAGFSILVGADSDALAVETHTANVGGLGFVGDLTDPEEFLEHLRSWGIRRVDAVVGGPPCQPFSRAGQARIRELVRSGRRNEQDLRAQLWQSFVTVVDTLAPATVLIENVPDLPAMSDGEVLLGIYDELRSCGYNVDARVLEAWRYGVPQHRTRLFIVAFRGRRQFEWPKQTSAVNTLADAIRDLPIVPGGQRADELDYYGSPETEFQRRMRAGVHDTGKIYDHITRAVRADDAEAFRCLPEGGTYLDVPVHLRRYRDDIFTDKYKRLAWDELSRTITAHIAKDGYWYIHPSQPRTLSVREAARIQTFPDSFRFAGEPTHRFRQIGNAVPPLLAEAIGSALADALAGRSVSHDKSSELDIRGPLVGWLAARKQVRPWHAQGASPWLVLVAELTLGRVKPGELPSAYACLKALAGTPADALRNIDEIASGLGRVGKAKAAKINAAADFVLSEWGGDVPIDDLSLRDIPGVGDAAAQAVLCFAYGRRAVLLDTQTTRIAKRLTGRHDSRRWQTRLDLYRIAGATGPDAKFNSALVALASDVCTATDPACQRCPVLSRCAFGSGAPSQPELEVAA